MKIAVISHAHSFHRRLDVPEADLLVHCGDFLGNGSLTQLRNFCDWLKSLPHKHKIVIAGNHDTCLEKDWTRLEGEELLKSCCHYLMGSSSIIDEVKFYGSPWQPHPI